jgi:putative ABC transport system permease protein
MLKNFFKVAIRNLLRQKAYSILNLLGLSLGIACTLLLTLHIKEELSYDKNFPQHSSIYRVVSTEWSKSSPPLAGEMIKAFPEMSGIARFSDNGINVFHTIDGKKGEEKGFFADSSAVSVFDLKTILGDPFHALTEPSAIVLTRSMARRYFGDKDPIGQKLTANDADECWVRAVIEDLPPNTHLKFDFLRPMPLLVKWTGPQWMDNRNWMFGWTYFRLRDPADITKVKARLAAFWTNYRSDMTDKAALAAEVAGIRLQPLTDIHLHSDLIQEMGPNSSVIYIYIFVAIGALILLIACINFVNLFTTQSLKRLKEVAVRKVLGAPRSQLLLQFLGEAFILATLSGLIAVVLYQSALPFYNHLTGRQVSATVLLQPANLLIIAAIVFSTGLLSGLFPALFITGSDPTLSLKGAKLPDSKASLLRKSLVVFQFIAAGFLIISTLLVYRQMSLFRDHQLGFDKDQVVVIPFYGSLKDKIREHPGLLKNEFMTNPDILSVGAASNVIGDDLSVESVTPVNAIAGKDYPSVRVYRVDENYLNVLKIQLKEGRNFSSAFHDSASFIINETAARILEIKDPINALLINNTSDKFQGKVVGVVKDFHFASLHSQIEPLVLEYRPRWTNKLMVRVRAGRTAPAIAFLKEKVAKLSPETLFNYSFLDDRISGLYRKEENMSTLLKVFSAFSVLISCLGLFGLAAYAAEVRTREIGIRKVIGASTSSLVSLLSRDFMIPVLIGNLLSWPLAWWAIHKWLQEFTYRIDIGWQVFIGSLLLTAIVAMLTIGFRCLRTARINPIKSLRSE